MNKTTKFLAKLKWKSLFSCLDPELVHHTGGVFAQAKKPFNIYNVKPNTKAASKLLDSGRFGMYGVELGTNLHTIIFTCYGWTNGRGNQLARERTDDMCKIIYYELQTHPGVPMLFTGDLNCSRELLPHLDLLINDLHWTDVGASAEMWGGVANENTCFFDENSVGTRNDYMIVNPQMIPYIRSFKFCMTQIFERIEFCNLVYTPITQGTILFPTRCHLPWKGDCDYFLRSSTTPCQRMGPR